MAPPRPVQFQKGQRHTPLTKGRPSVQISHERVASSHFGSPGMSSLQGEMPPLHAP